MDHQESRDAVGSILENMEILHEQVIDVRNEVEGNREIEECVRSVAQGITKIKANGVCFTMDVNKMTEDDETNVLTDPVFREITKIKCQHTLSEIKKRRRRRRSGRARAIYD